MIFTVILDARGVSKGYGFLRFSNEDEQKHCLKNMGGSLGLGCRPIRVGPVTKGHTSGHGFVLLSFFCFFCFVIIVVDSNLIIKK